MRGLFDELSVRPFPGQNRNCAVDADRSEKRKTRNPGCFVVNLTRFECLTFRFNTSTDGGGLSIVIRKHAVIDQRLSAVRIRRVRTGKIYKIYNRPRRFCFTDVPEFSTPAVLSTFTSRHPFSRGIIVMFLFCYVETRFISTATARTFGLPKKPSSTCLVSLFRFRRNRRRRRIPCATCARTIIIRSVFNRRVLNTLSSTPR